jgi:glycosyltransferase involved in cell wall biosynthesis
MKQIESWISNSDLRSFEVILVIDSAQDRTRDETQEIAQKIGAVTKVQVLVSEARNPGGSRNLGLEAVSGDWVVFWDCDDAPNPSQFLEMIRRAIEMNAEVAVGEFAIQSGVQRLDKTFDNLSRDNVLEIIALNPGLWRFAFKSDLAKSSKFPDLRMAEDQIYLANIFESKPNLYVFKEHVYTYWRYRSNQLTVSVSALNQLVFALDVFINKYKNRQCTPILMVIIRLTISAVKNASIQVKVQAVSRLLYVVIRYPRKLSRFVRLLRLVLDSK